LSHFSVFSDIREKRSLALVLLSSCRMRIARFIRVGATQVAPYMCLLINLTVCVGDAAAQSQATPQSTPPASAAFATLQLPSWVRLGVEHRGRLEGPMGTGFAPDREDLYWLNRFRVTARFSIAPWLSAAVQAQDARVEGRNGPVSGAPFRDQFDLRLAHADFGNVERGRIAVRAGRQELAFGDQRLVGHVSWLNTARTFDAVRGVFRHRKIRIDGFAASVVAMEVDEFNSSGGGNYFYGADAPLAILPLGGILEPYQLVRSTRNQRSDAGGIGTLTSSTTGVRLAGKLSPLTDYNVEAAVQRGSIADDNISAWAGHWTIGRTLAARRGAYRVFGEYNYASGDETPGDGERGTFDQLYPTPHDKYGLADQVGWKNIHHLRAGLEFRPQPKLSFAGGYHSFWLATARDALYNAAGVAIARVATGAANRHVGQEIDVQATFAPSPRIQLHGGYSHLFTGAFLKAATPGESYSGPYVMVTTMLLGTER
jgi:hypothetical protein